MLAGTTCLAKKQKSAFFDEGVCELVEYVQKTTGTTYPRFATAAILQHVFGELEPEDPEEPESTAKIWMVLAVKIEDGELTIDDVPSFLLSRGEETGTHNVKELLELKNRFPDDPNIAERLRRSEVFRDRFVTAQSDWLRLVSGCGSERSAIQKTLDRGGFRKPHRYIKSRPFEDTN